VSETLDLTGVPCPMNWVRTKLALEPLASVPRSASEDGHGVAVEGTTVTIVKGAGGR
jgi:hypothetical protein